MTGSMPDDYYEALGVARDATPAAIKTAYRKLVLKHHPDKVGDDVDKIVAADRFHKIQTAWETVGDEDKRQRYDAQVRLAALRREKELAERQRFTTPDYRPSPFRTATEMRSPVSQPASPRAPPMRSQSYRAVEVKPGFDADSFDRMRTSERRDFDFGDQGRRRRSDDRPKVRLARQDSKETERARHREKGRQNTKATNRDRDMKYSYSRPEVVSDSDSESYFDRRSPRDQRDDEFLRRERYMAQARQQAEEERSNRYMHEHSQKLFADAQHYQQRMKSNRPTESRRPSPSRVSSSREHLEFARTSDGRPAAVRRGSLKPRTSSRDDVEPIRSSRRGSERDVNRSSNEYDESYRRPPTLAQTKSAPNDIRIPVEKQRSNSVQHHAGHDDFVAPSPVRRADSMPHAASKERSKPVRSSTLRQISTTDDYDSRRSPTRSHRHGGRSPKDYDELDSPTARDPYRTEVREPFGRRVSRSPSPMSYSKDARSASNRHPVQSPRMTSTQYTYPMQTGADILAARPKLSRGESSGRLFGELPTTRSSRDRDTYTVPPPAENIRVREMRPEPKVSTGYTARRPSAARTPSYQRTYSSPPVSA